jgi:hypothetical protein
MTRCVVVVLVVLLLVPSLGLAQEKAGVVTTLEGNVQARRAVSPAGVPLKFKDDVFLQDQINTADKSLARMLLGGKAVVTVRERSSLTITEVPGKTSIDLESGKFALAVAREKMRPGEEIQIRTPNAIAGVRGTVVVTEVVRQGAQTGGPAPAVLTNFYVLRGTITAQQLDPGTRQPTGAPLNVGTLQAYSGAGTAPPRVAPVPPEQVSQITSGLSPTGPKGGGDTGQEQVKTQQVQQATVLIQSLTGGTGTEQLQIGAAAPLTIATTSISPTGTTTTQNTTTAPIIPTYSQSDLATAQAVAASSAVAQTLAGSSTLAAALKTFSGTFTSTSANALFQLLGASIRQSGTDPFLSISSGSNISLAGPLVTFVNSDLTTGGSMLAIASSVFKDTSTSALIGLDPSTITAGDAIIALSGGSVTLAGSLLKDVGGTLTAGAQILRLSGGASLTDTGSDALFSLTSTTAKPTANFIRLTNASTMTLAGPLFSGTNTTVTNGSVSSLASFFSILDGSTVTGTGTSAFITLSGGTIDSQGNLLSVRRSASTSSKSTLKLAGPLFSATNATVNTTSTGFAATFGTTVSCCSVFGVQQGGVLTSTATSPLVNLSGSTIVAGDSASGGNVFSVSDTFTGAPSSELVSPATVTLAGPLLSASSSTITALFSLLSVNRSTFTSTTGSPLISLSSSTVNLGGTDISGNTTFARVLSLFSSTSPFGTAASPASLSLAGPFLSASNSSVSAIQILGIFGGSSMTSTTTDALISLVNTTLKLTTNTSGGITDRGDIASLGGTGSSSGSTFATLTLSGPLLSVSGSSTLTQTGQLAHVFAGGQIIESHATSPFVSITGGSHTIASESGQALFRLAGRTTATASETVSTSGLATTTSSLTLGTDQPLQRSGSGAFLEMSGATINAQSGLILDTALVSASAPLLSLKSSASLTTATNALNLTQNAKLTTVGPFVKLDNASLTVTSGHAIRVMGGSFLNITGDLFSISNGGSLTLSSGSPIFVSGGSVLKVSGALVNFNSSTGSISATNQVCTSTCATTDGIAFFLQNSASSSNISITNAIKNQGSGTISLGTLTPVIILDGSTSKVIISGN